MACGFGLCFTCTVPVIRKDGSGYDNLRACIEGRCSTPHGSCGIAGWGRSPADRDAARGVPGGQDVAGMISRRRARPHEAPARRRPERPAVPLTGALRVGLPRDRPRRPRARGPAQAGRRGDAEPHVRAVEGWATPAMPRPRRGCLRPWGSRTRASSRSSKRTCRARQGGRARRGSVAGASLGEYVNVASALHLKPGVVALEVCVSRPDEERGASRSTPPGAADRGRRRRGAPVPRAGVREAPAAVPGLVETARACVRAGAPGSR